jgi:hypothetical protein
VALKRFQQAARRILLTARQSKPKAAVSNVAAKRALDSRESSHALAIANV